MAANGTQAIGAELSRLREYRRPVDLTKMTRTGHVVGDHLITCSTRSSRIVGYLDVERLLRSSAQLYEYLDQAVPLPSGTR
jgi:hypothetical protein